MCWSIGPCTHHGKSLDHRSVELPNAANFGPTPLGAAAGTASGTAAGVAAGVAVPVAFGIGMTEGVP